MTYEFDATISSAVEANGANAIRREATREGALSTALLGRMHRYWRAANYLTVGQIYLQDNPLLREPLRPEHIKPRLLGHWGTSPGLSLVYVHLNRLIREHDVDVIFLAGPGHGGPAVVANVYLEGTYSEVYPEIAQDAAGMRRLFRQFSTPGGVPEPRQRADAGLDPRGRRARLRARPRLRRGVRQPRPDRRRGRRRRRGGDRRRSRARGRASASSTPRATARCCRSCTSTATRSRARPCSARAADDDVASLLEGHGYDVALRRGRRPAARAPGVRGDARRVLSTGSAPSSATARDRGRRATAAALAGDRAAHAEGLDRAEGGRRPAGRGHVPRAPGAAAPACETNPAQLAMLEAWMRSYQPGDAVRRERAARARARRRSRRGATGAWARTRTPTAARCWSTSTLPDFRDYAVAVAAAGDRAPRVHAPARRDAARHLHAQREAGELPPLLPRRDQLEPAGRRLRGREPLLRRARRSASTTTSRRTAA